MAYVLADNIISPLGTTSEENYQQVKAGKSGIRTFEPGSHGIPEGFTASLLSDKEQTIILEGKAQGLTSEGEKLTFKHGDFEHLAIASALQAMEQASALQEVAKQEVAKQENAVSSPHQTSVMPDWGSDRVVFILSSTKGDIEKLGSNKEDGSISKGNESDSEAFDLSFSAQRIAHALGITTPPIVVCNACISGLSALILGSRLIENGAYDYAVVCGVDCPDRFVISGFQSLKALSTIPCRPFDIERFGLNLGEAAATIILGKNAKISTEEDSIASLFKNIDSETNDSERNESTWQIENGFVKNDAFHISAPSKTAEGLYAALTETLHQTYLFDKKTEEEDANAIMHDLAFINAHGTATLFNDQMESVAIERAGLSDLPTNALKGYFGHTLGAAGILETIISMKAIDDHTILGTRGFEELGVSGKVNILANSQPTDKHAFIKMLSGFGGCNATLWASTEKVAFPYDKNKHAVFSTLKSEYILPINLVQEEDIQSPDREGLKTIFMTHSIKITQKEIIVDGKLWEESPSLTALYKKYIDDYPKFYKMDGLSRLGFVASEILLQQELSSYKKKKLERDIKKREKEEESIKTEWNGIKIEDNGIKIGTDGIKTKDNGIKIGTDGIKTKGNGIKIGTDGIKTKGNGIKAETDGIKTEGKREYTKKNQHAFDRAIVLFNHSSSIASDRKYLASIATPAEYFPSPSVFVYTLPNIVTGEIAMRHGYHGETSFYILPHKDQEQMGRILGTAFNDPDTKSILGGWLDYEDEEHFEADLSIYISFVM